MNAHKKRNHLVQKKYTDKNCIIHFVRNTILRNAYAITPAAPEQYLIGKKIVSLKNSRLNF